MTKNREQGTGNREPSEDLRRAGEGPDGGAPAAASDDLETLREKADTYYRNWQRSAADFINFKQRVERERSETARLASAALVINLLPIFDDLDRATTNVDAQLAGLNWVQGVLAIHRKFASLMEAMNVTEVAAEGESFDPSRHEAVGKAPGEEGR